MGTYQTIPIVPSVVSSFLSIHSTSMNGVLRNLLLLEDTQKEQLAVSDLKGFHFSWKDQA